MKKENALMGLFIATASSAAALLLLRAERCARELEAHNQRVVQTMRANLKACQDICLFTAETVENAMREHAEEIHGRIDKLEHDNASLAETLAHTLSASTQREEALARLVAAPRRSASVPRPQRRPSQS